VDYWVSTLFNGSTFRSGSYAIQSNGACVPTESLNLHKKWRQSDEPRINHKTAEYLAEWFAK
jgi:hypothetical protein